MVLKNKDFPRAPIHIINRVNKLLHTGQIYPTGSVGNEVLEPMQLMYDLRPLLYYKDWVITPETNIYIGDFPGGTDGKASATQMNRKTRVQSLGQEDPLEKEITTHSSTLAWKIPWTEEPARLQSMGLQRVGHNWVTECVCMHTHTHIHTYPTKSQMFSIWPFEMLTKSCY